MVKAHANMTKNAVIKAKPCREKKHHLPMGKQPNRHNQLWRFQQTRKVKAGVKQATSRMMNQSLVIQYAVDSLFPHE